VPGWVNVIWCGVFTVTWDDADEGADVTALPAAIALAVTVKVYPLPGVRPVTVHGLAAHLTLTGDPAPAGVASTE
jgi:hypothetical protein